MESPWLRALHRSLALSPRRQSRCVGLRTRRSPMRLERLEDRTVPATYYWVGAANSADPAVVSSWSNPNNWDLNGNVGVGVPGATDIAA